MFGTKADARDGIIQELRAQLATRDADYRDLMEKYHELRQTHDAPIKYDTPGAAEQFGPLTRIALADMARGQSGAVVRAMRNKALEIWFEQRGTENRDEVTAIAIRRGEPLG